MTAHNEYIRSLIGDQRSLVITCLECCFDIEQRGDGNAFRYTALANALNPEDQLQREALRAFVEFKACSQIIVAGHYDCHALDYILNEKHTGSPIKSIQPQLHLLASNNYVCHLQARARKDAVVELNVIHQCKTLIAMFDFSKRIDAGTLTIRGVVIDQRRKSNKQIFNNGFSYNHLISAN